MQVPDEEAMKAGLLVRLAKQPIWLAGIAADALGLQGRRSRSRSVESWSACSRCSRRPVFALPPGAGWTASTTLGEIVGAAAVVEGVALFVAAEPNRGDNPELECGSSRAPSALR